MVVGKLKESTAGLCPEIALSIHFIETTTNILNEDDVSYYVLKHRNDFTIISDLVIEYYTTNSF